MIHIIYRNVVKKYFGRSTVAAVLGYDKTESTDIEMSIEK